MPAWKKCCVAAIVLVIVSPLYAKEDKKDPKDQGGFFGRVKNMFSRDPNNAGGSKTPNETASNQARKGFDTPSTTPSPVQPDKNKAQANAADLSKAGNKQIKQEELDRAKRFPATGKAPPSPTTSNGTSNAAASNNKNNNSSNASSSGNKSNNSSSSSSNNKNSNSNDKNKK
jgi:hypothetical protein